MLGPGKGGIEPLRSKLSQYVDIWYLECNREVWRDSWAGKKCQSGAGKCPRQQTEAAAGI